MFYLSEETCAEMCRGRGWKLDDENRPIYPQPGFESISFIVPPAREHLTTFCRAFADIFPIDEQDDCLLWMMHWNDWGGRTNYHLYYKLRRSYSNFDSLSKAPGHLFLGHETNDLVTFLQMALLFGWDFHLLPFPGDCGAFHDDEMMTVYSNNSITLGRTRTA